MRSLMEFFRTSPKQQTDPNEVYGIDESWFDLYEERAFVREYILRYGGPDGLPVGLLQVRGDAAWKAYVAWMRARSDAFVAEQKHV